MSRAALSRPASALAAASLWAIAFWIARSAERPKPLGPLWTEYRAARQRLEFGAALAKIEELLEDDPDNAVYLKEAAFTAADAGRFADSAALAERFMSVSPTPAEVCPLIGKAYWRSGSPERSLDALRRCAERDPGSEPLAFNLAQALEEAGRLDEAEKIYERLLAALPGLHGARVSLARLRLRQGRAADSESLALAVLREEPGSTGALWIAALSARAQGARGRALGYARRLLARQPQEPAIRGFVDQLAREAR